METLVVKEICVFGYGKMFRDIMLNKKRKCGVDTKCIFFSIKKTGRYSLYIAMYVCRHWCGFFQNLLAAAAAVSSLREAD